MCPYNILCRSIAQTCQVHEIQSVRSGQTEQTGKLKTTLAALVHSYKSPNHKAAWSSVLVCTERIISSLHALMLNTFSKVEMILMSSSFTFNSARV